MRYYGVVHRDVGNYAHVARNLLGQLDTMMATTNQTFGSRTIELGDGAVIRATIIKNGAVPIYRVHVEAPEDESVDIVTSLWLFENGRLMLVAGMTDSYPNTPELDPLPLSINIGTVLAGYFSGPGTTIASGGGSFHLQGDVLIYTDFLPDAPANIMPIDPYESAIYTRSIFATSTQVQNLIIQMQMERDNVLSSATPAITLSSNYTGLMRLLVQSCLAVGRSPGPGTYINSSSDLLTANAINYPCPFGNPNPYTDGIIYDSEYNFWWVRVGEASVAFRRLRPNYKMAFAQEMLKTHSMSAEDEQAYLSALTSSLSPDTSQAEIVVNVPGLANVTGGGRAALAYGWHFNRAAPWQAAIATIRDGVGASAGYFYFEATKALLDFSFLVGVPTCSLTIINQDTRFIMPYAVMRYIGFSWVTPDKPSGYTWADDIDNEPALYCFFKDTGALEGIYIENYYTQAGYVDPGSSPGVCGFGSASDQRTSYSTWVGGGVYTESISVADIVSTRVSTLQWLNTQTQIWEGPETLSSGSYGSCDGTDVFGTIRDFCNGDIPDSFVYTTISRKGLRKKEQWSSEVATSVLNKFGCISVNDAEAVSLASVQQVTDYATQYNFTMDDPDIYEDYPQNAFQIEQDFIDVSYRCESNGEWIENRSLGLTEKRNQIFSQGGYSLSGSEVLSPYSQETTGNFLLSTSTGIFERPSAPASPGGIATGSGASFSYNGDGVFNSPYEAGGICVGDYVDCAGSFRWIGSI